MANPNDTPARIVDAALRVIARRGPARMSMSDAAEAAAISRGTLYRYFKSKDELMEAIAQHVRLGVLASMDDAVAGRPAVADRVRVTTEAILRYGDTHPEVARVIEAEPAFALSFIQEVFPEFVRRLAELLDPVLAELSVVREGRIRPEALAELLMRAIASVYFVPTATPDAMIDAVLALWTAATHRPDSTDAPLTIVTSTGDPATRRPRTERPLLESGDEGTVDEGRVGGP